QAGGEIRIKKPAVGARGRAMKGQITEDIFALQLGDRAAVVDESAGDGDPVAVIVFERAEWSRNWIDQIGRRAGAAHADRACGAAGAGGAVKQKITFLHRPAIIPALGDAIDFLDRVLPDIRDNELAVGGVE